MSDQLQRCPHCNHDDHLRIIMHSNDERNIGCDWCGIVAPFAVWQNLPRSDPHSALNDLFLSAIGPNGDRVAGVPALSGPTVLDRAMDLVDRYARGEKWLMEAEAECELLRALNNRVTEAWKQTESERDSALEELEKLRNRAAPCCPWCESEQVRLECGSDFKPWCYACGYHGKKYDSIDKAIDSWRPK